MYIAVDFDGTVVSFDYPKVGQDIGAVPVLRELVERGHKIILLTMRSGKDLEEAVKWFEDNNIPLYDINRNKSQFRWTTSRKVHANLYIDDQALGAPNKVDETISDRPFIDWTKVRDILQLNGLL